MPSASERAKAKLDAVLNDPGRHDCSRKAMSKYTEKMPNAVYRSVESHSDDTICDGLRCSQRCSASSEPEQRRKRKWWCQEQAQAAPLAASLLIDNDQGKNPLVTSWRMFVYVYVGLSDGQPIQTAWNFGIGCLPVIIRVKGREYCSEARNWMCYGLHNIVETATRATT